MFLQELINLATNTSLVVILLLVIGVIFCFIEAIVPSFGFWGITGILSTVGGIVVHAIVSASAIQVLIILLVLALIFTLITLLFIRSAKYGLLAKLSFVENKTALPLDYEEKSDFDDLDIVGKTAKTITEFKPVGKIELDDMVLEASSKYSFIEKGQEVLIVKVEGNLIYVEKI